MAEARTPIAVYREFAARDLKLAKAANLPRVRDVHLEAAKRWTKLADDATHASGLRPATHAPRNGH